MLDFVPNRVISYPYTGAKFMLNTTKSKDIAYIGIFSALVIVLQSLAEITRMLGLPMSLALGLIPVLIAGQLRGIKVGAVVGGVFGLVSLVLAVIYVASLPNSYAKVIINPLVSVFPRIMVGVVSALVYKAFTRKGEKSRAKRYIFSAISALCGVVTNTVLFLGMYMAFAYGKTFEDATINFAWILAAVVAINTLIEAVCFPLISGGVVSAVESKSKKAGDVE